VKKAVAEHFEGDFISSVYVLIPQFEGIVKDYLGTCGQSQPGGFVDCARELKRLILARKLLMFPCSVLDLIFDYLENSLIWKHTSTISDPSNQVNRHGILHGVFTKFEAKGISLKYLIHLDSLAFVVLHDRIVTGRL